MDRLIRHFSLNALVVWAVAIAVSAMFVSIQIAFGVFVGGALGLLNVRAMARSVKGLDLNNPNPQKLIFGGAFRLIMLCTAIVLIAMTGKVDLVGLLVGFTIVVFVLMATALMSS